MPPSSASPSLPTALAVLPSGTLVVEPDASPGETLLALGARLDEHLPPTLAFGRELAKTLLTELGRTEAIETLRASVELPADLDAIDALVLGAPPMKGGEYLRPETLVDAWNELLAAARAELAKTDRSVAAWLHAKSPAYAVVGRVCFHLAENKRDDRRPFAFLATYASHIGTRGEVRYAPLARALEEYGGARKKADLERLLEPVRRAADASPIVRGLLATNEIFHPLAWTAGEAFAFLREAGAIGAAGVVVKMPDPLRHPARPRVTVTLGKKEPGGLGFEAMLDFDVAVTLGGERLSPAEARAILASGEGFVFLKGRWVEVDGEALRAVLDRWQGALGGLGEGVSFAEAMRLLAGLPTDEVAPGDDDARAWSSVVAGPWLDGLLTDLRDPSSSGAADPGPELRATLRPYQRAGVAWLTLLARLRLGACLADDMGLGKTIQVIALVLALRRAGVKGPHLLVLPASLLGNWTSEIERFAPTLRHVAIHPSATPPSAVSELDLDAFDVVLTTYGTLLRTKALAERAWTLVVVDEAQAIKNPLAKQTHAVKSLRAASRIALTGTPIENQLGDLWSIFDFLCPGLLGTKNDFRKLSKRIESDAVGMAPLRALVRPYLLRRMKTDRSVVADLPDKTEVVAWCSLSKTQAAHYQRAVEELAIALRTVKGIQRRGLVLAFLMRFKQICNHPSQWLGDGRWKPEDSGKMARLREICEPIAARQEKALVFTQFRETTEPLAAYLATIFGRPGLVLSGETPVKKRKELVDDFQSERGAPFFVLSVKAGGTGLNLTAASHVVHFDRWWNPAVEAQATDRAFRIGQKKNVLVHKLVCRGTIEERIDRMLEDKRSLAEGLFEGGAEKALTELPSDELLRLVSLDVKSALGEG